MLKNFGFWHAFFYLLVLFGGYMALDYYGIIESTTALTIALVLIWFSSTLYLGIRAEKYGNSK